MPERNQQRGMRGNAQGGVGGDEYIARAEQLLDYGRDAFVQFIAQLLREINSNTEGAAQ